jgi:hypothetical protein
VFSTHACFRSFASFLFLAVTSPAFVEAPRDTRRLLLFLLFRLMREIGVVFGTSVHSDLLHKTTTTKKTYGSLGVRERERKEKHKDVSSSLLSPLRILPRRLRWCLVTDRSSSGGTHVWRKKKSSAEAMQGGGVSFGRLGYPQQISWLRSFYFFLFFFTSAYSPSEFSFPGHPTCVCVCACVS